jgi:hypothetical protein
MKYIVQQDHEGRGKFGVVSWSAEDGAGDWGYSVTFDNDPIESIVTGFVNEAEAVEAGTRDAFEQYREWCADV